MNDKEISLDTVISRNDFVLSNRLGDEIVMMDAEKGAYYGLESVAARIWELTENPISVKSLCNRLVEIYNITFEQCYYEVEIFLSELLVRRIISTQ